jgi:uncharacterized membrane protein
LDLSLNTIEPALASLLKEWRTSNRFFQKFLAICFRIVLKFRSLSIRTSGKGVLPKDNIVYRISIDAMFIALYFALSKATFPIGNIHLTLASLPVVVASLTFGVGDTLMVALLGEFMVQIFSYGFAITLPLWLIGPLLRGLIISFASLSFRRKGKALERHSLIFYSVIVLAAVVTTAANTLALYLDALIIGYPITIVWLETLIRFCVGIGSAVLVGLLAKPLVFALRRFRPSLFIGPR